MPIIRSGGAEHRPHDWFHSSDKWDYYYNTAPQGEMQYQHGF